MARRGGRAAPGPARGRRAVVACVEGEHHAVGARMLADFLQMDGWAVDFLGADLPARDLVDFVARRPPDLVALSVTLPALAGALATAVSALRRLAPSPRILAGGAGLGPRADAAALGVDAVAADALAGVRAARRLAGAPPSPAAGEGYFERLGRRVQELRAARGLTQQQLARAADLDRTYVSGVERGKQNPTLGALLRLAQALDVPLERLVLDGEGEPAPVAAPAGPARTTRP
jgi:DNA-binding XRE family transcriptional regulator